MNSLILPKTFLVTKPLIGMVHLPALPGSPRGELSMGRMIERALRDAEALAGGGVHGLMVENFGDVPFYPGRVPAETVAAMTAVAAELRRAYAELPLGINVLRNDGLSAMAIAAAVGASFVRVNVLCGARVTDQGIVQGVAHELMRERAKLRAEGVKVLADVDVKHSTPLGAGRSLEEEVEETLGRGLADAVIVSGQGTGKPTDLGQVRRAKSAAGEAPVFIGSGVTPQTIGMFLPYADGFIVGSAFKAGGRAENAVEVARVRELVAAMGAVGR